MTKEVDPFPRIEVVLEPDREKGIYEIKLFKDGKQFRQTVLSTREEMEKYVTPKISASPLAPLRTACRYGSIFFDDLREEVFLLDGKPSGFDSSKEWKKVMTKEEKEG